jgi:hypothetical protein
MSHLNPIILDTPEEVVAANLLRVECDQGSAYEWKLGDSCWYGATEINRAMLGIPMNTATRAPA